ncbi:MAG TPA: glycosyltransferase family 39 protein [Solirubrobacterales bacterium]|nr:glycosyltransferase family 39 protein [Solirubrobacterales bacterium]
MATLSAWLRSLPERHGRVTLILLAAILALGFGLRAYRVVEPLGAPGDDSRAYFALAKGLYEEGSYGALLRDSSDWSPGAPLLYSAAFYVTDGAREGTARIVELLCGLASILLVYLLGRRLGAAVGGDGPGRQAGLLAAFGVAVYPPFIHSTGALFSEPPAMLTLPAAILAFLWASDAHATRAMRWMLPGFLLGLTAMIRPEYLLVGIAFGVLAAVRIWRERGLKPGVAGATLFALALLLPIVPWTVRNAVVLDRLVPISTGGGKALYVGTNLPGDGEYQRVKALLVERQLGRDLAPGSEALDRIDPTPLFDRVAARHPDLPRDEALGKIGKENLYDYVEEDPLGYAAMTVRKVWRMWSGGVGEAMASTPGRIVQVVLVLLGLAGLALLGHHRRLWEALALATPLALVTAVGAISLAAPRRNEILMTLVFPLAATALVWLAAAISSRRRWPSSQASSPPS